MGRMAPESRKALPKRQLTLEKEAGWVDQEDDYPERVLQKVYSFTATLELLSQRAVSLGIELLVHKAP